jgi:hypothetical protein
LQEGDLLLHFPGAYKAALPAFLHSNKLLHPSITAAGAAAPLHNWLHHRRLLRAASTAAAAALELHAQQNKKAASDQEDSSKHQHVGTAAATLGAGAVENAQAGIPAQQHDVPCFAVYDNHARGGTDAAGRQARQQHADLVEVIMISTRHQDITTTTKISAITLSIQRQQARAGQAHMQGFASALLGASTLTHQHTSHLGWPR